jgi:anaerobic selenocysteine-containing dehydrogenase/TorA maturation chaperone TorD
MNATSLTPARIEVYKFLSTLLHDEVSMQLLEKLRQPSFVALLRESAANLSADDNLTIGTQLLARTLDGNSATDLYRELRFEYAELFLNSGNNPCFPYASCYLNNEPLVMQEPVFTFRESLYSAGVHKRTDYLDLDDHIGVELEFMRFLLEKSVTAPQALQTSLTFFQEQLLGWATRFAKSLIDTAKSDFYRALSLILAGFLAQEDTLAAGLSADQPVVPAYVSFLANIQQAVADLSLGNEYRTLAEGPVIAAKLEKIKSHCFICLGLCGQEVQVKDGIIQGCKGLPGDPKGGGRLCIKGAKAHHNTYSAYRLKTPLIRENGRFRKASWDEALALTAANLNKFSPVEVGFHRGNDYNNWCHEAVMTAYGTPHKVTHRQMCDNPARMANEKNFSEKRPYIDYENSAYIMLFGMNELATSAGQRKVNSLKNAVKRGAKLVVIDPRKSDTARIADEWIAIKPGTDGAFALAMCYVLVTEEMYDKKFVEKWTYGFDQFRQRLVGEEDGIPRNPEWAAEICGISAGTIRRLAREVGAMAPAVGVNSWTGVTQAPNTLHAVQAIIALNALVGSFDAPGGPSIVRKYKLASAWGDDQPKPPNNAPKVKLNKGHLWSGWHPAYFEQDVDAGKLKAMICYFGNPVMSCGNEPSVRRAVEKLDFSCGIDCYMSNTTELCDVILPDCTYLEQSRVIADWMYESFISLFQRAIPPMYDTRSVVEIFQGIAQRLGYGDFFPWKNEDEFLSNQLRNQDISLEELRKVGYHITDPQEFYKYKVWGSVNPPAGYGSSGSSPTGKYNFLNPLAEENGVDGLPDYKDPWADWPELQPDDEFPLIFGYFRVIEHEHSSTYWNVSLMKACGTNPVWINCLDAKERGINSGDKVCLKSPWGTIEAEAKVTWDIRQGVLAAAGGFGNHFGLEGDPKYPEFHGFNTNVLVPPNTACKWTATPPLKYVKATISKICC